MTEELIIRHCAPTLAGLKTGNIFTTAYESEAELDDHIDRLNNRLGSKGLRVERLRVRGGRALIYVYRPGQLMNDFQHEEARMLLEKFGYSELDETDDAVSRLSDRICANPEFPHEIGLFLGYPPEDVKGFINSCGRDCKACGYWKVYGNAEAAETMFQKFDKCTCVYLKSLEKGIPFEKLAVQKKH